MTNKIAAEGRWLRLGGAAGILLLFVFVALSRPGTGAMGPFFPCAFHSMTGLPCLFCGGTRAAHAVLNGDFGLAWYLNPLAFPALTLFALAFLVLVVEAGSGRRLGVWEFFAGNANRNVPFLLGLALVWWGFHLASALRAPKPELVNFQNPIAAKARACFEGAP